MNEILITNNIVATEYFDNLLDFIKEVDGFFKPRLSSRVSLEDYAIKLCKEAYIYLILEDKNNKIIAAAAYYCTPNKFDFAFLTFIASMKKGLGGMIVEKIISHCKQLGAKGIETQTWEKNSKSLKLFRRFKFKEMNFVDNRNSSLRSILLKLKFDD